MVNLSKYERMQNPEFVKPEMTKMIFKEKCFIACSALIIQEYEDDIFNKIG